jgi:hypothetical protein
LAEGATGEADGGNQTVSTRETARPLNPKDELSGRGPVSRKEIIHQAYADGDNPFPVQLGIREFHEIQLRQIKTGNNKDRRNNHAEHIGLPKLIHAASPISRAFRNRAVRSAQGHHNDIVIVKQHYKYLSRE